MFGLIVFIVIMVALFGGGPRRHYHGYYGDPMFNGPRRHMHIGPRPSMGPRPMGGMRSSRPMGGGARSGGFSGGRMGGPGGRR